MIWSQHPRKSAPSSSDSWRAKRWQPRLASAGSSVSSSNGRSTVKARSSRSTRSESRYSIATTSTIPGLTPSFEWRPDACAQDWASTYRQAGLADAVIVRIPRGGYVPVFERRPAAPVPASTSNGSGAPERAPGRRDGRRWAALAAIATSTLLLATVVWWLRIGSADGSTASAVRVAVLPFAHYSTDPGDEVLAARITDGVTTELVRMASLHVVSRTSTLQYATVRRPLREVAQSLNANIVVEASVLTEGDRVRVQARLVDPDVDRKLSLYEFEGTRQNLDELQRQIARAISTSAHPVVSR